jgi:glycosyltransferase involved in cell wall biosynthesis
VTQQLVSVITPAFNAAAHLAATIESSLTQTYTNFEHLIVDDGSTDATGALAERFARADSRVRVFRIPNGGVSLARNVGIEHARGSMFALLDSDDMWMPHYLETAMSTLTSHPDAHVFTANAINVGGSFDGTPFWPASDTVRAISVEEMIAREDAVHVMSVFHRSVIDRIGGFDPTFRGNEDYQFWLRAAVAGCRFVADFTPRGYYRRRPDSISSDERQMLKGIMRVLREIQPRCPAGGVEVAAIAHQLRRFNRELMLAEAKRSVADGDSARAIEWLGHIPSADRGRALSAIMAVAGLWPPALTWTYRTKQMIGELQARVDRPSKTSDRAVEPT